ncbi:MAG: dockerin type I repeat-containing protein [Clostridia bacterium]|nr:dockerin type I repeat-containing protein [Clostridia bacterium]
MKRNKVFRLLCGVLCAALLAPCGGLLARAETATVVDATERAQMLAMFNDSANGIKTFRPHMKMESHIAMTDATTGARGAGETLDDSSKKYLAWLLDACFTSDAGIAQTLFNTIQNVPRLPKNIEFVYGEKRDNRVPLIGERYVSALTEKDDFVLKTESVGGTLLHPEDEVMVMRLEFPSVSLEEGPESSLAKLFDLPSPVLNPVVVSGDPNKADSDGKLSEIEFRDFTFENAYAQAQLDSFGNITELTESIEYTFEISFYDLIRIISAYSGVDWMTVAIAGIANPILGGMNKDELEPKDALDLYSIYVTYTSYVRMTDFNWHKRYFGDVNSDQKVDPYDARAILRHSVGLEEISNQLSQAYADMDFDGVITPADARLALRTSVGLEELMLTPPEGKQTAFVIPETVDIPVAPDDPLDPVVIDDPDPDEENNKPDITSEVAGFTGSIMDIINALKGSEGVSVDAIRSIVEEFRKIGD